MEPGARVYERLADLEQRLRNMEAYLQGGTVQQIPVVTALPVAGRAGRLVMLDSDKLVYRDTGVTWLPL
jgi:hypothetical protein